jgi:hypothetical protein
MVTKWASQGSRGSHDSAASGCAKARLSLKHRRQITRRWDNRNTGSVVLPRYVLGDFTVTKGQCTNRMRTHVVAQEGELYQPT